MKRMVLYLFPIIVLLSLYWYPRFWISILKLNSSVLYFNHSTLSKNKIALTFDDTPSKSTNAILDILLQYNLKATFFIISSNITSEYEPIMQRIVREGHHLGNHLTEDKASIKYTAAEFEQHLLTCHRKLQTYQTSVKYLRPGSGWYNSTILTIAKKHDYQVTLGSVYPHDAQLKWSLLNSFYVKQKCQSGDIIILHDRPWTLPALASIAAYLVQSFHPVTLPELLHEH